MPFRIRKAFEKGTRASLKMSSVLVDFNDSAEIMKKPLDQVQFVIKGAGRGGRGEAGLREVSQQMSLVPANIDDFVKIVEKPLDREQF